MRSAYAAALAIAALLLCLNLALKPDKDVIGDGFEYLLMSESFLRHGDPELTPEDHAAAALLIPKVGDIFAAALPPINNGEPWGYYRSHRTGGYYSQHFWFYPLVNVPALALVHALDWPPVWSFVVTNSVLLLLALGAIFAASWLTPAQKFIIAAGAVLCGTTYYLNWGHPEVFTYLGVLVGSVLLYGRHYKSAGLLFALAAQQNLPIAPLCAAALLLEVVEVWRLRADRAAAVKRLALCVPAGLVLLLQAPFYWWHFGVPSLLAARGNATRVGSRSIALSPFSSISIRARSSGCRS
jgi:hypothetical protein